MKGYSPSDDFVARVMTDVRAFEKSVNRRYRLLPEPVYSVLARWSPALAGLFLGLMNMGRLLFSVFAPVGCG